MSYKREQVERLLQANPTIGGILKDAPNHQVAKNLLVSYLNEMYQMLNLEVISPRGLEWALQISCILALRRIVSVRSESLSGFSIMPLLWRLSQGEAEGLPDNLSDAFFEDLIQILLGTTGRSRVYDNEIYSTSAESHGREAAQQRSDQLDAMARRCDQFIKRYPSGLDDQVQKEREQNRDRILKHFGASADDWTDHQWQLSHIIRTSQQLEIGRAHV